MGSIGYAELPCDQAKAGPREIVETAGEVMKWIVPVALPELIGALVQVSFRLGGAASNGNFQGMIPNALCSDPYVIAPGLPPSSQALLAMAGGGTGKPVVAKDDWRSRYGAVPRP